MTFYTEIMPNFWMNLYLFMSEIWGYCGPTLDAQNIANCQIRAPSIEILAKTLPERQEFSLRYCIIKEKIDILSWKF